MAARDGYCRLAGLERHGFGACGGRSTWHHLDRRSRTRGQAPEQRHTVEGSLMACERHHDRIDHQGLQVVRLTPLGASGALEFYWPRMSARYREAAG